jgi:hypothetical protein
VAVDEVLCMHCKHEIVPDRDGFWVHLDGGFKCQVANVRLSTFAEPPGPPSWPLNSAYIRDSAGDADNCRGTRIPTAR